MIYSLLIEKTENEAVRFIVMERETADEPMSIMDIKETAITNQSGLNFCINWFGDENNFKFVSIAVLKNGEQLEVNYGKARTQKGKFYKIINELKA